jgi:hypothetical protein
MNGSLSQDSFLIPVFIYADIRGVFFVLLEAFIMKLGM